MGRQAAVAAENVVLIFGSALMSEAVLSWAVVVFSQGCGRVGDRLADHGDAYGRAALPWRFRHRPALPHHQVPG